MQVVMMKVSELRDYEKNARTHSPKQLNQIAESIKNFGFNDPIEVDNEKTVLSGHGRLAAAKLMKLKEVPVVVHNHLSEEQKKAYILAANRIQLESGWDTELLRGELTELLNVELDLTLTGFNPEEIGKILNTNSETIIEEDEVPEPTEFRVKRGDVWQLGRHKLMCGDTIIITDVQKLMGEEKADLVVTDPPYNVNIGGEALRDRQDKIKNDNMSDGDFQNFLNDVFMSYNSIMANHAGLYLFLSDSYLCETKEVLQNNNFEIRNLIFWFKKRLVISWARYKTRTETILYAHKKGEVDNWYGDKKQTNVWEIERPKGTRQHPTMKPLKLLEIPIKNSSLAGDLIVDLFGGSGSTLITCELLGRKCYTMELDPKYCDVILTRWEKITGKQAVLHE